MSLESQSVALVRTELRLAAERVRAQFALSTPMEYRNVNVIIATTAVSLTC